MTAFIEEMNPNIMAQESLELLGMDIAELKADDHYEPTPEDWREFSAWCESVEPEPDLDKMYAYYFPDK